jgi:putative intracellular protease/amidase
MSQPHVLLVLTSAAPVWWGPKKTGYFWPELTHIFLALTQAGMPITLASATGTSHIDEVSIPHSPEGDSHNSAVSAACYFDKSHPIHGALQHVLSPGQLADRKFDGVFFVGGHGTLWDFPTPTCVFFHQVAASTYEAGGIIGAICHGPSALSSIRLSSGDLLVKGKRVTGYADAAEAKLGSGSRLLAANIPTTQRLLSEGGAIYECHQSDCFGEFCVVDGRVITGQNPYSGHATAQAFVAALQRKAITAREINN